MSDPPTMLAGPVESIVQAAGIKAPAVLSLADELDLGRLGAAIALASVVVSGNTGPAHLAAAISTPLVDLYAPTNPLEPARVVAAVQSLREERTQK